jgi:hypothetical protein
LMQDGKRLQGHISWGRTQKAFDEIC